MGTKIPILVPQDTDNLLNEQLYTFEEEEINITMTRLLSKVRTMAAMSYKISRGHKVVYPRSDLTYCANFLNMMFDTPVKPYEIDPVVVKALEVFWILHADHEQNCSTTAARVVGSSHADPYSAVAAACAALARRRPDQPDVAERFELYIAGVELCNGFSELTDPVEQRERFERETDYRRKSGKPVYPMPEKFLTALGSMPAAAGNALGIDRLVMLFSDSRQIDDVVAFTPEEL